MYDLKACTGSVEPEVVVEPVPEEPEFIVPAVIVEAVPEEPVVMLDPTPIYPAELPCMITLDKLSYKMGRTWKTNDPYRLIQEEIRFGNEHNGHIGVKIFTEYR